MSAFTTYEYRLDLSNNQKKAISELLDKEDNNFNDLALLVSHSFRCGASVEDLHAIIDAGLCGAVYDNSLRKELCFMVEQLTKGFISEIKPHFVFRNRRHFRFSPVWVSGQSVLVPGIGWLKMILHRLLPPDVRIYHACLTEDECRSVYKISFCLQYVCSNQAKKKPCAETVIGLDYKQDGLYVDSNGRNGNYPGFWLNGREKVSSLNQTANRFTVGSRRWLKFRKRAAKLAGHIERQRKDWQYKKAAELAAEYDAVCIEHLDFNAMQMENATLSPKIRDNNWWGFRKKLEEKLSAQGKPLIEVSKYYPSSQICSICGYRFGRKPLDIRTIICPRCGQALDRDINAACNIRDEGLRLLKAG